MKSILILTATLLLATTATAAENGMPVEHQMPSEHHMPMHDGMPMHNQMHDQMQGPDERISLGLTEPQRSNQLAMMRGHLKSVNEIVALLADDEFDKAATVAHQRLGLTSEMQQMCSMFGNARFQELGLSFHQSADELGETLKSHDKTRSLKALNRTINYCISCHQTFRQ